MVITGSVCLDKFIVDTDRLSASRRGNMIKRKLLMTEELVMKKESGGREQELEPAIPLCLYSSLFWLNNVTCEKTTKVF